MTEPETLKRILEALRDAMKEVAKIHGCSEKDCYLKFHPKDVITIDVRGKPVFHFFDEQDLIRWLNAQGDG